MGTVRASGGEIGVHTPYRVVRGKPEHPHQVWCASGEKALQWLYIHDCISIEELEALLPRVWLGETVEVVYRG